MFTSTIYILIFAASGYRPAAVIAEYPTMEHCQAAIVEVVKYSNASVANANQFPFCLKSYK